LQLNALFKDNMVLQRDAKVSVYGSAPPGSRVTVSFNGQQIGAQADEQGDWELKLGPLKKSFQPQELVVASVTGKESVSITNVLVGDVWLCGGQSNMELGFGHYSLLAGKASAIRDSDIRSIIMERRSAGRPEEAVVVKPPFADAWREAREPWVDPLSPTAYFFAAKLRRDLDVPIGLVISAVGGSQIQRWMPKEVVESLQLDLESTDGAGTLYHAMIHPLRRFTIKGVIWYQGESNGRIPHSYYALSKEHIRSWRALWARNNPHLEEMPFFTVQIAPFKPTVDGLAPDAWAYIREAQLKTLELPNTGLIVTTDLGEFADIHPQNKQPVGERLALWAEQLEGGTGVVSGPLFEKAVVEGDGMRIFFSQVGSGLETRRVVMSSQPKVWAEEDPDAHVVPAGRLAGFVICGADRKFVPAEARIVGDQVRVSSPEVPNPVAVRYGWSTFPLCNLYNKEGLPASPFRSDDFPIPDVQGRKVGSVWDRDEAALGSRMQFTGSNPETQWVSVERDGLPGDQPAAGQSGKPIYAYYRVTDNAFKAGNRPQCVISIVYFDNNTGAIELQYDSSDPQVKVVPAHPGAWKTAGIIKLNNTGKWSVLGIPVDDAFLDGRCNGADVRVKGSQETILRGVYCGH
jgi:sialate O-acetylesterase